MALFDVSKMIATYINDFGGTAENLPIKLTTEAPIPNGFYTDRPSTFTCGSVTRLFVPRRLVATFDFGVHEYPLDAIGNIPPKVDALKTDGARCIDLVGERWVNVPGTLIGSPTFKSTPYSIEATDGTGVTNPNAITGSGDKEVGDYQYNSDLSALGTITLRYNIEKAPSDILTAAKGCLTNPVESEAAFCSASSLGVKPRYFTIKAAVGTKNTLARQAKVSSTADLATCGAALVATAYCLGYQGESIKNIDALLA